MRKFIAILILFHLSYTAMSQTVPFPVRQQTGGPSTLTDVMGGLNARAGIIAGNYADTATANLHPYIKYYAGAIIRVAGATYYKRNAAATKWEEFGGNQSSVTSISIVSSTYTSTVISICTASGSCSTQTVISGVSTATTVNILNDTTIILCDASQVCDTVNITSVGSFDLYQNGVRKRNGIVEHGNIRGAFWPDDPAILKHNTVLNTGYWRYDIDGLPIFDYVQQTSRLSDYQSGTAIVAYEAFGSNPGGGYVYDSTRLGINYFGGNYQTSPLITGYMGDRMGFMVGINMTGVGSYGLKVDDIASKMAGMFLHTKDDSYTDAITFVAKVAPGASPVEVIGSGESLLNDRIMTLHNNKNVELFKSLYMPAITSGYSTNGIYWGSKQIFHLSGDSSATDGMNYFIGKGAGAAASNTVDFSKFTQGNIGIGTDVMKLMDNGWNNVGIGNEALAVATTAQNNIAIGRQAMLSATSAYRNISIGQNSLNSATSAQFNTALGTNAGYYLTTGVRNTFLGGYTGTQVTTGGWNVAVGEGAGLFWGGAASYNVHIGNVYGYVGVPHNRTNAVTIGYNSLPLRDNMAWLGNGATRWSGVGSLFGVPNAAWHVRQGNSADTIARFDAYNGNPALMIMPNAQLVLNSYAAGTFSQTAVMGLGRTSDGTVVDVSLSGGGGSSSITMTAIGSSPNGNGATASGTTLTLQPASSAFGGVLNTSYQEIAGTKDFTGGTYAPQYAAGYVTGTATQPYYRNYSQSGSYLWDWAVSSTGDYELWNQAFVNKRLQLTQAGAFSVTSTITGSGFKASSTPATATAGTYSMVVIENSTGEFKQVAATRLYAATASQTGTNAPTATVQINQLSGTPTFARTAPGVYTITLAGGFPLGKTHIVFPGSVLGSTTTTYEYNFVHTDVNTITITSTSRDVVGNITGGGGAYNDGVMNNLMFQILIFP